MYTEHFGDDDDEDHGSLPVPTGVQLRIWLCRPSRLLLVLDGDSRLLYTNTGAHAFSVRAYLDLKKLHKMYKISLLFP